MLLFVEESRGNLSSTVSEIRPQDGLTGPSVVSTRDTGMAQKIVTRRLGKNDKALFSSTLAQTRWEFMYTLPTYVEQFIFFQETMDRLVDTCCPLKPVSRSAQIKQWSQMGSAT